MIFNMILKVFFSIIGFILSFLPGSDKLNIADNILEIFGYGLYIVGVPFFTIFMTLLITHFEATLVWKFAVWLYNKIRGSG